MKRTLFAGFLALALVLSACQNNSEPTSPASTTDNSGSALVLLEQLDLTNDQIALVDEMFYLDEDMSILLDDGQFFTFNQLTDQLDDRKGRPGDDRDHPFPGRPGPVVDMDALMYFRLIMKACDHTEDELAAIRALIAESHRTRAELVKNATDRDALVRQLQAEHTDLMAKINRLIGPDCIDAVEALKAEIQAKRDAVREKMAERRIQAELDFLTKLLGLTEDQIADVKALIIAKHEAIAKLREQYKGDPEGLRAALAELMERFDADMLNILNDDQDAIYMKWRGHTVGDRPDPGTKLEQEVARLTKMLGLSELQAAELKALLMKKMEAEKQAFEKYGKDRAALAKALQGINQQFNEAFMKLLTEEQLARWKKLHQNGPVDRGPIGRGG